MYVFILCNPSIVNVAAGGERLGPGTVGVVGASPAGRHQVPRERETLQLVVRMPGRGQPRCQLQLLHRR